jgi:hypothetical protein
MRSGSQGFSRIDTAFLNSWRPDCGPARYSAVRRWCLIKLESSGQPPVLQFQSGVEAAPPAYSTATSVRPGGPVHWSSRCPAAAKPEAARQTVRFIDSAAAPAASAILRQPQIRGFRSRRAVKEGVRGRVIASRGMIMTLAARVGWPFRPFWPWPVLSPAQRGGRPAPGPEDRQLPAPCT